MATDHIAEKRTPSIKKAVMDIRDLDILVDAEVGLRALVSCNECRRRSMVERMWLGSEGTVTSLEGVRCNEVKERAETILGEKVSIASILRDFRETCWFLLPSFFTAYIYTIHNPLHTARSLTEEDEILARTRLSSRHIRNSLRQLEETESVTRTSLCNASYLLSCKIHQLWTGATSRAQLADWKRIQEAAAEDTASLLTSKRERRELEDDETTERDTVEIDGFAKYPTMLRQKEREHRVLTIFDVPTRETRNRLYHEQYEEGERRLLRLRYEGLLRANTWFTTARSTEKEEWGARCEVLHEAESSRLHLFMLCNKNWFAVHTQLEAMEPERRGLARREGLGRREVEEIERTNADRLLTVKIRFKGFISKLVTAKEDLETDEKWGRMAICISETSCRALVHRQRKLHSFQMAIHSQLYSVYDTELSERAAIEQSGYNTYADLLYEALILPMLVEGEEGERQGIEERHEEFMKTSTEVFFDEMGVFQHQERLTKCLEDYEKVSREQLEAWWGVRGANLEEVSHGLRKKWNGEWCTANASQGATLYETEAEQRLRIELEHSSLISSLHGQRTWQEEHTLRLAACNSEASSRHAIYLTALQSGETWDRHVLTAYEEMYSVEFPFWGILLAETLHRDLYMAAQRAEWDATTTPLDPHEDVTLSDFGRLLETEGELDNFGGLRMLFNMNGESEEEEKEDVGEVMKSPVALPMDLGDQLEVLDIQRLGRGFLDRRSVHVRKLRHITTVQAWFRCMLAKQVAVRTRQGLKERKRSPFPLLAVPHAALLDEIEPQDITSASSPASLASLLLHSYSPNKASPALLLPFHHKSITRREQTKRDGVEILYKQALIKLEELFWSEYP